MTCRPGSRPDKALPPYRRAGDGPRLPACATSPLAGRRPCAILPGSCSPDWPKTAAFTSRHPGPASASPTGAPCAACRIRCSPPASCSRSSVTPSRPKPSSRSATTPMGTSANPPSCHCNSSTPTCSCRSCSTAPRSPSRTSRCRSSAGCSTTCWRSATNASPSSAPPPATPAPRRSRPASGASASRSCSCTRTTASARCSGGR